MNGKNWKNSSEDKAYGINTDNMATGIMGFLEGS